MAHFTDLDFPHTPGAHPDWQESWVLIFRDRVTNCVGFLRTGSYPNQGTTQTHWGMALPDGTRFRRHLLDRRMQPGDRTEKTASSGTMKVSFENPDYVHFQGHDPDAEADLRIYDFYPSQNYELIGASRSVDGDHTSGSREAHGHPESAGRVEGHVRIGDHVIEIKDGYGYREHGFGPRALGKEPPQFFRSARAHFGSLGPALSYSLITSHAADGSFHKFGFLMLDGRREKIKDFHTFNSTFGDGLSVVGGWTQVLLENGQKIRIDVETIDGIVTSTSLNNGGPGSSSAGVEALSIPRWNGHEGICDFNMIDNAHRGEQPVSNLFLANSEDGLSKRKDDLSWIHSNR
ncbi:MAG: hypothetical protein JWQ90_2384 [Hydrocarboniphaga sp.]|uniref:DUF7064 domain-containing protein n=1 Tax=Hydrocarboniphaga sp. TaxID=2033016 RepID=UPI0026191FA9|nr:hypothetical protein [Hydrocarboniphaga sp.]MDB5969934.1 hypothetical protein [Hydrocarboniphaga sp.]